MDKQALIDMNKAQIKKNLKVIGVCRHKIKILKKLKLYGFYKIEYQNSVMSDVIRMIVQIDSLDEDSFMCDMLACDIPEGNVYYNKIILHYLSVIFAEEIKEVDFPIYLGWKYKSNRFLNIFNGQVGNINPTGF